MTIAEQFALAEAAGCEPHELKTDPKLGLLVSPSGARKMAAIAPDRYAAATLNVQITKLLADRLRVVS
jgi:hypothetical protein